MDLLALRRAAAIRNAAHIAACISGERSPCLPTGTVAPTAIPAAQAPWWSLALPLKGRTVGRSPKLSGSPIAYFLRSLAFLG